MTNIAILRSGTPEIYWSLLTELLDAGKHVYVCDLFGAQRDALARMAADLGSRRIDAVIGSHLLAPESSAELLFLLLGEGVPAINLALGHPLVELQSYVRNFGLGAVREHGRRSLLQQWIGCPHAAREYALAGFDNGFYRPLPVQPRIAMPDRTQRRWLAPGDVETHELKDLLRAVHNPDFDKSGRLIYLGTLAPRPEEADTCRGLRLERLAQDAVEMAAAFPERPRLEHPGVAAVFEAVRDESSFDEAILFHNLYAHHFSERVRLRLVARLKKEFGPRFDLYGDDWRVRGLDARATGNGHRGTMYRTAAVCLDFGSLSFETCLFPRTIEVMKSGGCLLSLRRPDSAVVFGRLQGEATFGSEEEMLERVSALLADPARREALRAQTREQLLSYAGGAGVLDELRRGQPAPGTAFCPPG